ncbi:MAG: hypothetical protein WDM78_16540 [Puia sp.]
MGKIILHLNITPDGFCDHRSAIADEQMMKSVNKLLGTVDKSPVLDALLFSFLKAIGHRYGRTKRVQKMILNLPERWKIWKKLFSLRHWCVPNGKIPGWSMN